METIDKIGSVVYNFIKDPKELEYPSLWRGLKIDKRKPHTERLFIIKDDIRICLHKFSKCSFEDSFPHPHAWEMMSFCVGGYGNILTYQEE